MTCALLLVGSCKPTVQTLTSRNFPNTKKFNKKTKKSKHAVPANAVKYSCDVMTSMILSQTLDSICGQYALIEPFKKAFSSKQFFSC